MSIVKDYQIHKLEQQLDDALATLNNRAYVEWVEQIYGPDSVVRPTAGYIAWLKAPAKQYDQMDWALSGAL